MTPGNIEDAREAFLNLLADADQFDEEPDGDETGDHTRFVIITGWRQLAGAGRSPSYPWPPLYGDLEGRA